MLREYGTEASSVWEWREVTLMKFLFGLMILLVASTAFAQSCDLPSGAYEVEVWKLINGSWVSESINPNCATGRLWASGAAQGSCNKRCWELNVQIHASIAQWIWFNITGTRWDWRIMKPGTYAGDCITFQLCSNGPVAVNYEGFEDLYSATACDTTITTWYGYGPSIYDVDRLGWVRAPDLNGDDDVIAEVCPGHCTTFKLWSKVQVDTCNTACEYHDDAKITLCLRNQKCWVDADGSWWDREPCVVD
jgi:hypothetical protein